MRTPPNQQWQNWVTLILGLWLIIAPFAGFVPAAAPEAVNSYVSGVLIVILSAWALDQPQLWKQWLKVAIGIWLILAPFAIGFTAEIEMMWSHLIAGILVGVAGLWATQIMPDSLTRRSYQKQFHQYTDATQPRRVEPRSTR
jgi:hypothetical protein